MSILPPFLFQRKDTMKSLYNGGLTLTVKFVHADQKQSCIKLTLLYPRKQHYWFWEVQFVLVTAEMMSL